MRFAHNFRQSQSGAAAIEFAIISFAFIGTILFLMIVAVILYFGQALDFATDKAARQIMTGQVQGAGTSQTAFRKQVLCPYLPGAMNCDDVIINVQTVTQGPQPGGYYSLVNTDATALLQPTLIVDSNPYSVGSQGSFEYIQVLYPVTFIPGLFARILGTSTYKGSPAYILTSTQTFKNELYN